MSENTLFRDVVDNPATRVAMGVSTLGLSEVYRLGSNTVNRQVSAKKAQESLENQRRTQLEAEATARAAARRRAETTGQRAGISTRRTGFLTNLGFGGSSGRGRGTLFGN